jgi:hypothetical protein
MATVNQIKIEERLMMLETLFIPDAKKRLARAADAMLRRAQESVKDSQAMLADEPCFINWMDFAEGELREAKEAKANLVQLLEESRKLQFYMT